MTQFFKVIGECDDTILRVIIGECDDTIRRVKFTHHTIAEYSIVLHEQHVCINANCIHDAGLRLF